MSTGLLQYRNTLLAFLIASVAAIVPATALAQEVVGTWETARWDDEDRRSDQIQLDLRVRGEDGRWNHGSSYRLEELDGLTAAIADGDVDRAAFRLVREAGTITFEGAFRDGEGGGTFRFAPDPQYLQTMAGLGYDDLDGNRLLLYATLDVTTDYVRGLADLGYADLDEGDLTRFAIHGVRLEYIREMNALGYEDIAAEDLVRMRIHGVSADYVRAVMAALR